MNSYIQWGKRYDQTQIYSSEYCCPKCDWRPQKLPDTFGNYTVGIDSEWPKSRQANMPYIQIVECPKDFTLFWMHINRERILIYKQLYPEKFKGLDVKLENQERIKIK